MPEEDMDGKSWLSKDSEKWEDDLLTDKMGASSLAWLREGLAGDAPFVEHVLPRASDSRAIISREGPWSVLTIAVMSRVGDLVLN